MEPGVTFSHLPSSFDPSPLILNPEFYPLSRFELSNLLELVTFHVINFIAFL
jgi:hypothetical protein